MFYSDQEILDAFFDRRKHFDNYLEENKLQVCTCPGCGYPTLAERGSYEICPICDWEDDGQDDHIKSPFDNLFMEHRISGPNGNLTLTANRINIGRMLQNRAEVTNGVINLDTAVVLQLIAGFNKKRELIENKMTGEETLSHPVRTEWKLMRTDLQAALVCTSN